MQYAIFLLLSLIFFLTPFQKGLYFPYSIYATGIFLAIICILVLLLPFLQKEKNFLKSIIVFLLPLCLLISLPFADSPKGAWDLLLKWVFYAEFFFLLTWVALNPKIKRLLPIFFQANGMMLAIFMFLNFYGVVDYRAAVLNGRFAGVFQYPNTFGMVMIIFFMFALINLLAEKDNKTRIVLYASSLVPFFTCFIMSYSRGMMLVLPVIWLIGLALLPTVKQIKYIVYTGIAAVGSLSVYQAIETGKSAQSEYPGMLILLLMIFFTVVIAILVNSHFDAKKLKSGNLLTLLTKKYTRFILPSLVIITVILGILDLTNDGILFRSMPEKLQDRIAGINLNAATAKERLYLYEDALVMSKDSPLIGYGGGGWASSYKKYQQIPYQSNKVHNGYLEVLIDTGWIGLIIFLGVFFTLLYLVIKSRQKSGGFTLQTAVIIAVLTAFAHSFLDFDFSYGTIWLLIFWLFAAGISSEHFQITEKASKSPFIKLKIIHILIIVLSIVTIFQSVNYQEARKINSNTAQGNSFFSKEDRIKKTLEYDPDNIKYYLSLSNVFLAKKAMNDQTKIDTEALIVKMTAIEPNNSTVLHRAARLSERIADDKKTLEYYNRALTVDHFNTSLYEDSMQWKVKTAIRYSKGKYHVEANQLLDSALKDFKQMASWDKKIDSANLGKEFNSRNFSIRDQSYYYSSLIYYLKKDYPKAIQLAEKVKMTDKYYLNAITLSILSLQKTGNLADSQLLYYENIDKYEKLPTKLDEFRKILF